MSQEKIPLSVSIRELPTIRVASVTCDVNVAAGGYNEQTREGFEQLFAWVKQLGHDTTGPAIGVPNVLNEQLVGYECVLQVPDEVKGGSNPIEIKELSGGKYAIITIEKDPTVIPKAIQRFFQEYVPQNRLEIDDTRPEYEFYYENVLDQCIPVL